MSILKKRVSFILAIMMMALTILPFTIVSAASQVSMTTTIDGANMVHDGTYYVKGGEKIVAKAKSSVTTIERIGYYYEDKGIGTTVDVYSDTLTITVPTAAAGSKKVLRIEAIASNDDGSANTVTKTGWYRFNLVYQSNDQQEDIVANVKYNGKTLADGSTTTMNVGDPLVLSATPASNVKVIYYLWDNGSIQQYAGASTTINVPSSFAAGSTHKLYVVARDNNMKDTVQKVYTIKIPASQTPEEGTSIVANVKYNGATLADRSKTSANAGDKLELSATPANNVKRIYYLWDNATTPETIEAASGTITIPTSFAPGSTHKLYVVARDNDNNDTVQKIYTFVIPSNGVNPTDDGLDVLPWEKENSELESLAISLRNDSESDKENKNIYALEEEVTYFIDYKNGGKDIKEPVTIKLELPLTFEVVSADNGAVDYNKGTITWTYPQGMESEQEGTKTVVVKYTKFDKKGTEYKTIYPLATISKSNKVADSSSVINLIYVDTDTTLDLYHIRYMYGDKNATTFRPDDTITRAEGALVLTRILLGQSAIDNVQIKSIYPDLGDTYEEAQKAIVAATSYGIINGYTDGYYRPNQTMTRAEFMKIIAKYIELNAEDEGIEGLAIKDIDNSVKLYKNPVLRYAVNGTTVSTHWAIEEVSLLVRLNMTSAGNNKDLRLDEGISRAEVAQLVNFYTFRAPAKITSRVTTQFSDVSRNHKLFADIVEATRPSHEARFNEDGTEHVK